MEDYLSLFEQAINKQAELVGVDEARVQAKLAGLTVSDRGRITSCTGNPMVVLLRLIRYFTKDGNLAALDACGPLIRRMVELPAELEKVET
jgi:hypothetical protein